MALSAATGRLSYSATGDLAMVPTAANGQPAAAEYHRADDNLMRAHSVHILTLGATGIAAMTVFLDPSLFSSFGLPSTR
ncbi:hypothetical protein [Mycobacterium persicum]|uniref:ECF RNA polymerase sigma factor SigG n=1 Tax=Mycobacterium persicum TaxID=1487726 RepID=A0AB38ULF3_9MYCO|nr:hypothetical protein [Mycobacterium persicum]ORB90324.1 hypothetical protein B1T49_15095 [Mycobacterium persicum]ORC02503.1 hypothetical protein B1T48_15815 [Mycobacterium persicum]VAZ81412.1 ECF RNA polymerase sigma factor SigG [Mycobacterium persicum]